MITVVIADHHPATRAGIRLDLTKSPEITLVGEAANNTQTLSVCQVHKPTVLLMGLNMPDSNALETYSAVMDTL